MSQKLVISVDASGDRPDQMTVQDVFEHILELFKLVAASDPEAENEVRWRLIGATMNSPFTVTAEAVPVHPGAQIEPIARRQKTAFSRNYRELRMGRLPSAWATNKTREIVSRVVARNRDGIGRTVVHAGVDPTDKPITFTKTEADIAAITIAATPAQTQRTKEQIGSIEGRLEQIGTHYNQPAIRIVERKSRAEVWCTVPEEFQRQISENTSIEDVWKGSRVVVKGKITYSSNGSISRVVATSVRRVVVETIDEGTLLDREFTSGLSAAEYLKRFRDGDLG